MLLTHDQSIQVVLRTRFILKIWCKGTEPRRKLWTPHHSEKLRRSKRLNMEWKASPYAKKSSPSSLFTDTYSTNEIQWFPLDEFEVGSSLCFSITPWQSEHPTLHGHHEATKAALHPSYVYNKNYVVRNLTQFHELHPSILLDKAWVSNFRVPPAKRIQSGLKQIRTWSKRSKCLQSFSWSSTILTDPIKGHDSQSGITNFHLTVRS